MKLNFRSGAIFITNSTPIFTDTAPTYIPNFTVLKVLNPKGRPTGKTSIVKFEKKVAKTKSKKKMKFEAIVEENIEDEVIINEIIEYKSDEIIISETIDDKSDEIIIDDKDGQALSAKEWLSSDHIYNYLLLLKNEFFAINGLFPPLKPALIYFSKEEKLENKCFAILSFIKLSNLDHLKTQILFFCQNL